MADVSKMFNLNQNIMLSSSLEQKRSKVLSTDTSLTWQQRGSSFAVVMCRLSRLEFRACNIYILYTASFLGEWNLKKIDSLKTLTRCSSLT